LPVLLQGTRCPGCRRRLDELGDHLSSCMRTGTVQRRAKPVERAWQRVFREAGGRVLPQTLLRDLGLRPQVPAWDDRRIDLVARGLPLFGGLPICGDAAVVSAIHADGMPWSGAEANDGVALARTTAAHQETYAELCASGSLRFVMLGAELGGRLSPEVAPVLWGLAAAKARESPALLIVAAQHAWHRCWLSMVAVAIQVAAAEAILDPTSEHRE
jgi:hypothetical protein